MQKYTYPVVVIWNPEANMYNIYVPDAGIFSEGDTVNAALTQLKDLMVRFIEHANATRAVPQATPTRIIAEKWAGYEVYEVAIINMDKEEVHEMAEPDFEDVTEVPEHIEHTEHAGETQSQTWSGLPNFRF